MMPVRIQQVGDAHIGQTVRIQGWLYNARSSGSLAFLEIRDGSGFIQAVASKQSLPESVWQTIETLTQESSVIVDGTVKAHPKKQGVYEVDVTELVLVQRAVDYPIAHKEHGPDFLLDNRHLWLRSKRQWATQRIRDGVFEAVADFFHERGYIKIDTPIMTPNACEGATELFEMEYFDEGKVFLSQSGQLYLEAAIMSVGRAYDFGPVFRAEKSKTKRHLTEFWMMDAEAAFVTHEENLDIQEQMVKYIVQRMLDKYRSDLDVLERDVAPLEKLLTLPFERLTYTDAIERLHTLGSDIQFGQDLGNDDEELLTKNSPVPVFIHKWPKAIKPFYMKQDPENPELVLNDDLIGIENAGEIIGGSQREDDYDKLKAAIDAQGLAGPEYAWYLDLRKYGSVPHAGFGLGLERMVRWMSGVEHIRETIPFPRMITRIRP
ncbi:MAG: asparagine--tRNA ligase [Candidatus Magasanikbacteria bacterium]|nr:asparagine--tRNA ligase [Candidatus Magasanikbacteria bacterium]